MGVDLSAYCARIGCFLARSKLKSSCSPVWLRPTLLAAGCRTGGRCFLVLFCVAHLIICAGDVETNPGPDKIDQVLARLQDLAQSNEKFHKDTSMKLKDIQTSVTDIKRRLSEVEGKLSAIENLREDVTCVSEVVQDSQVQLQSIKTKQSEQAEFVVDDLNNRMRRNNLIFKGIPEEPDEKWADTERLITEFVSTNLGIQAGEIERAHRVGRPKPEQSRPIVIKFLNFKDKSNILRNASKLKKLKEPRVWIEEDFSPRIQLVRKKLRDFAREKRTQDEKYRVVFDKLLLGNKCYSFDSSKNEVICLPRHGEAAANLPRKQGVASPQGEDGAKSV